MENSFDVFISYSRQDYVDENNVVIPNNPVSAIKELFSNNNISYWFDEDGIYHGDNFAEKIAANIEKSAILLFLSSVNSNASKWTSKEIAAATEWKKKIIPIRLDRSPYNRSVMLYISDLDFVEYYKDPISAQKTVLESIRNYKEELERMRILEEEKRKLQAKEREERERAEKRRQEQEDLAKEIANAIHIMRLSEEALEKQRLKLLQQINSLDSKSERKNLLLQLEQSNQVAFEERAKSRLLSETIDTLKKDIENKVNEKLTKGEYISKDEAVQQCNLAVAKCQEENGVKLAKQSEEYEAQIEELKEKCATLESDFARDEYVQKHKAEFNNVLLRLEEEKKKNDTLRNENAQQVARIDTLSKRKKRLHAIYIVVLLFCIGMSSAYHPNDVDSHTILEPISQLQDTIKSLDQAVKEAELENGRVNTNRGDSNRMAEYSSMQSYCLHGIFDKKESQLRVTVESWRIEGHIDQTDNYPEMFLSMSLNKRAIEGVVENQDGTNIGYVEGICEIKDSIFSVKGKIVLHESDSWNYTEHKFSYMGIVHPSFLDELQK